MFRELDNAVDKICREGGPKQRNSQPFTVRVLANSVVFDNCMWRKELQTAVRMNGDSL